MQRQITFQYVSHSNIIFDDEDAVRSYVNGFRWDASPQFDAYVSGKDLIKGSYTLTFPRSC